MALPNFIIIGAIKAGTTSLHQYCSEHPEIFMPPLKEPRFFVFDPHNPDHARKAGTVFPVTTIEDYEALFEPGVHHKAIGESSPQYLHSRSAPGRIFQYIPNVKLIASLRNPVDRAYSEYLMEKGAGRESREVSQAFPEQSVRIQEGLYHQQLQHYFEFFPSSRIKVVIFDDLIADPVSVMQDIYRYLGVDDQFVPNTSVRHNEGGVPRLSGLHRLLTNDRIRFAVKRFIPEGIRHALSQAKRYNMRKSPKLPEPIRDRLMEYYLEDIRRLEKCLGRDLSIWYGKTRRRDQAAV